MTNDEVARRMFNALDTNKDGQVSHQEWTVLESRAATTVPEEQQQQFVAPLEVEFKKLDSNGDGHVTFAEYQANRLRPSPCDGCTPVTPGWVPLKRVH